MNDLTKFKRLAAWAQKSGAKSVKWGDFEIEFQGSPPPALPLRDPGPVVASASASAGSDSKPAPDPVPTLDDFNKWIYSDSDPHEPIEQH